MTQPPNHPLGSSLELDESVPQQKKESWRHWADKAAIINWLRTNQKIKGTILAEKKVADKISDIRCECVKSPEGMPDRFVVEVQTEHADKNVLNLTQWYHRFGYAVYWVFDVHADQKRRNAEAILGEQMSGPASLGMISVGDGELQLGRPVTRESFEYNPDAPVPQVEFYIPTYDRTEHHYDHGDFEVHGDQMTIYSVDGSKEYYFSRVVDGSQRTLPQRNLLSNQELYQGIRENEITRVSPVRGAP